MKKSEIQKDHYYAVKVPRPYTTGTVVLKVKAVAPQGSRQFAGELQAADRGMYSDFHWSLLREEASLRPTSAYIEPWKDYTDRLKAQADLRATNARIEREAAEIRDQQRKAEIEGWIHAFDGIMVPAEALSHANFDRPDVDLGAKLRRIFVDNRAAGTSFGVEGFEVLASVISQLRAAAIGSGGTWSADGPEIAFPSYVDSLEELTNDDLYVYANNHPGDLGKEALAILERRVARTVQTQFNAQQAEELVDVE